MDNTEFAALVRIKTMFYLVRILILMYDVCTNYAFSRILHSLSTNLDLILKIVLIINETDD